MPKVKGKGDSEFKNENGNLTVKKGRKPKLFKEEPAYVSFSTGLTINLGNYESKKVDIGITRPCKNTDKEIAKTFKSLVADVNIKLESLESKTQKDDNFADLEFED